MNKKIVKWILVVAWLVMIFIFSAQPAEVSNGNNRFIISLFKVCGLNLDSILGNMADFLVRKAGHLTEYFILCILLITALRESYSFKKAVLVAIALLFLYACSDEFHQIFVPGREGRVRDVMIDTSGGVLAAIFSNIFKKR